MCLFCAVDVVLDVVAANQLCICEKELFGMLQALNEQYVDGVQL